MRPIILLICATFLLGCATDLAAGKRSTLRDSEGKPVGTEFSGMDLSFSWGRASATAEGATNSSAISSEASGFLKVLATITGGVFGAPPDIQQTFISVEEDREARKVSDSVDFPEDDLEGNEW